MAPLDDLSGDRVLAEFEAMIRSTSGIDPARRQNIAGQLMPERRAVNWVNALAALARELVERHGQYRTEASLRTIGSRMSRELLSPLPSRREEFEPAINRALSILDWGWVAVLERQDTIVFEHRVPWAFENRLEHLPFVLEGFYSDTLLRLSGNAAMQVRMSGIRGGALVLKWLPGDAMDAATPQVADVIVAPPPAGPSVPQPEAELRPEPEAVMPSNSKADELHSYLESGVARAEPTPAPMPATFATYASAEQTPRVIRPTARPATVAPIRPSVASPPAASANRGSGRVMLVAASVFLCLFAVGLASTGDVMAGAAQKLASLVNGRPGNSVSPELEQKALAGDADAQIRLALRLVKNPAAGPDYATAARWFQAAAKTGSLEAQYDLGVLTTSGLGVQRDPVGAAILFMSAAAGGFPAAEYRIGNAYQKGIGVPASAAFAAMWYERAARHGIRQAQKALGDLYASGKGIAADPVMAFAWYRLAEQEGDRGATSKRVELYRAMSTSQRDAAAARAKALISEVVGGRGLIPPAPHPTVDRLIAQIS